MKKECLPSLHGDIWALPPLVPCSNLTSSMRSTLTTFLTLQLPPPWHSRYRLFNLRPFFHSTYLLLIYFVFTYIIILITVVSFHTQPNPRTGIFMNFIPWCTLSALNSAWHVVNIQWIVVEWKRYCFSKSPNTFFTSSQRIFWNHWELIKPVLSPSNSPRSEGSVRVLVNEWIHPYSSLISPCNRSFAKHYPWFSFTDYLSITVKLGCSSTWFRYFTETDRIVFLFVCKYTHGMMQRIYAFRKHIKEVSSILLHAYEHVFQRYVITFNILNSLIINRSLDCTCMP